MLAGPTERRSYGIDPLRNRGQLEDRDDVLEVDVAHVDAGLGVLSYAEQAENWRIAMPRVRAIVQRWGIAFPAIPELDIEGVDVAADINPEDIIPVF